MTSLKVRFRVTEEVKEFVAAACKCDFDIDVCHGRIIVDAKSILGVLSMDLSRALTVQVHGESPEFNRVLAKFAAAV